MELQLTNEQLALFFDEDLKGNIITNGSYKYKITDPVLEINGLYKDEIEYDLSETPIAKEYDNTVLLTSIPMEYGVVYDSIILAKKDDPFNIHCVETEGKYDQYSLNVDWTTYDFGTGQDYAPDDDHEEEFYKEVELYDTNVQPNAPDDDHEEEFYKEVELYDTNVQPNAYISLNFNIERIIDSINTLQELIEEDKDDDWKLEILDGSVIQEDEDLEETIKSFIEYLNRYSKAYDDPIYTHVNEDEIIKIYKTDPSEYKTKLEAQFKITKD